MKILVTGGAGYIGSHVVKALIEKGHDVIIYDNLSRGNKALINPSALFIEGDLLNLLLLEKVFSENKIDCVIHLANFADASESVRDPMKYYTNNIIGGLNLLNTMFKFNVKKMIFSSSCTVFGNVSSPINENFYINPISPYGKTKCIFENFLRAYDKSHGIKSIILRYFNATGASSDASIGEMHNPETHLIPTILQVALGKKEKIEIFGDNYPTPDGTCIRDYVHVEDVANAHLLAMKYLFKKNKSNHFNLGIGKGYSVKQVIEAAKEITSCNIKTEVTKRREGDIAISISDNKKIKAILKWEPKYKEIREIIKTAWLWHKKNEKTR